MTTPVVTALRARGPGRVAGEVDGRPWRGMPLEAVVVAGLAVGGELDRATARALRRELRRLDARGAALRALSARDHTAMSLDRRLEACGTAPALRRETVAAAKRAGLVDDARFASARAALLAGRGAGDLMIADDLERQGVRPDAAREAIEALEPEAERAEQLVAARGTSVRTLRFLGAKGFSEETLERLVADLAPEGLG